jgi:hypothetical protein
MRLPTGAARKLSHQKIKFSHDWALVHAAFPDITRYDFLHSWLLVNTRSFHHATPATKSRAVKDQMVLQPVADLFNHECDRGCRVQFDRTGFSAFADRSYRVGEEVSFCYGGHSNDTLLVEYGFIMASNTWDDIILDDIIMPRLVSEQQAWLDGHHMLGEYRMDAQGVCHRTEAALRATILPYSKWVMFAQGDDDGHDSQVTVDQLLHSILSTYIEHTNAVMFGLIDLNLGDNHPLLQRWLQVATVTRTVIDRLESTMGREDARGTISRPPITSPAVSALHDP